MADAVVVGGGYAGLAAVRELARRLPPGWRVHLVDKSDAHELVTRLPEIVAGRLDPDLARIPFQRVLPRRARFIRARALSLDLAAGRVETSAGPLHFDRLILASGMHAPPDTREWFSDGFPVRSVAEAVVLRDTLARLHDTGSHLRVAIVGAGYTGLELAGELLAMKTAGRTVAVTLLTDTARVLPSGDARLAAIIDGALRERNVDIQLGTHIETVTPNRIATRTGRSFEADVVIWAGQQSASDLKTTDLRRDQHGRVRVSDYLEAVPERLFVAGDIALLAGVPSNAQLAIEEGSLAAENLVRSLAGKPQREFRPRMLGEAISLGPDDGVAEVLGVVVRGRSALAVKRAALARYLYRLGGAALARQYGGQGIRSAVG